MEQGETALAHMVTRIPVFCENETVKAVRNSVIGTTYDCADTLFITNDAGTLAGIVRINDLFTARTGLIGSIMEEEHEAVYPEDDQEQIAMTAMERNMIAVPVVDDKGQLLGAIPPEALLRILRGEHMEDLQRIAGISPHDRMEATGLDLPLRDRYRRRIPWLLFGLLASSLITIVMAGFEESLSENLAVAFFVPAIVYIAGAIGTQSVSVAVRGLADEDVKIAPLIGGEITVGAAIGATLGLVSFLIVLVLFRETGLAYAVGFSVFSGGIFAAFVGFGLPWLFMQLGSDPAMGSGPVCTIIQDVSSLLIYFVMVDLVM